MVLYLKEKLKIKMLKQNKNPGSRLEAARQRAQPIQPIFTQIGLDWLCYLAGNF